jgi:hypothetical protein
MLAELPGEKSVLRLTEAGQARYREIRASVDETINRVYGDIPTDDLATAGRVLTLITARLNAEDGQRVAQPSATHARTADKQRTG